MRTSIKAFAILFILLLFVANISFATDINMNLQANNQASNTTTNETLNSNTTTNETLNSNTVANEANEDYAGNSFTTNTPSTTVSSASSEEPLSFSNILNILLIVVGVVLILLGIAILIRTH